MQPVTCPAHSACTKSDYEQSCICDPAMLQHSWSWETADIHYPGLFTETRLSKAWVDRPNGTNAAHLFSHTSFFLWRGIYLLLHGQQRYPYTGLQIKAAHKSLHSVDLKPCSKNSRVWMKYEKKAPGIHQTAESAGYFACPDILHESCLHLWWCYHCHLLYSHFRSLICPWARTAGFSRIVTKLVNLTVRNFNTPSFSVETK